MFGSRRKLRRKHPHPVGPDWCILGWLASLRLEHALRRQMAPDHWMRGKSWSAFAHDTKQDAVLYLAADGEAALVHLTWMRERTKDCPSATSFKTLDDALHDIADAIESGSNPIYCPVCKSDWSLDEFDPGCFCCGGGALVRDCPVCDGRCGAEFRRAILDSQDSGEAHWNGSCLSKDPFVPN
ncbi:hypothetical protein ACFFUT_01500 [Pseudohalocynthiibacter aestuariivivens]|jgi:hypothetical protein|uniref:Uncharacterized protein n=1 Tax=Pseudohalocynthiibacter aestuariivivens TaxID=1591409 RepID=A0ABV5JAJ0_9RHOB|nr:MULTISPECIES: hypothetical protein [Pseudohalocynthiibacter]MBS9715983.1 hypothetical protein [Pseudohalocynthiibacter aestuariivivens]MCK0102460.1 hypothetical protein [Pseudohalocynthiibacter sp. F2068]